MSVDTTPPVPHEIYRGRSYFRTVPSQRANIGFLTCGCQCGARNADLVLGTKVRSEKERERERGREEKKFK